MKDHGIKIVSFSGVAWFREMNIARQTGTYGSTKDLEESFVDKGWQRSGDGVIDVENITSELIVRAMAERTDEHAKLKADISEQGKIILAVWEGCFLDSNGELVKPEYVGISGNRRASCFLKALAVRKQDGKEVDYTLPVHHLEFASPLERMQRQVQENEGKTLGFMPMSDVNRLITAKKFVELGADQQFLRKTYTPTTGQKLFGVLTLNVRFPELNLYERCIMEPKEGTNFIKLSAVPGADLPKLVLRSDPKALAKENDKREVDGLELIKPTNAEEVEKVFTKGRENKDKIMKRESIVQLADNFPVNMIRNMAKAIVGANTDSIEPYRVVAPGINALDSLIQDGDYPQVEGLLLATTGVAKGSQRDTILKSLTDTVQILTEGDVLQLEPVLTALRNAPKGEAREAIIKKLHKAAGVKG